ncbi:uncharacterized protein TNCV_208291 [Trichonephila clavipes]|uniref:Uncharacterized protein n=1 Tax=Trichonephila clavipes TaxID=2585209 RepID=A0A8X6VIQ0_TRICX|nr:uncharacterized protein TNCV_208291 [Trichonephila clavipes]
MNYKRKLKKEAGKRKRVDLTVLSKKKKTQLSTSAENSAAAPKSSTTVPEHSAVPENSDVIPEKIFLPPKESKSSFQKAYKTFDLPNNDSSLGIIYSKFYIYFKFPYLFQKFTGPCCNSCNLAMKNPKFLPVFFYTLSGYAMRKYLPLKYFVWSDNNLNEQDSLNLSDESVVGYILEVDLEYPPDFHDKHSDFPLAPENKLPPICKEPRLLTTLEPKTKYVPHYSNLKLYLKLGLVLKKFIAF